MTRAGLFINWFHETLGEKRDFWVAIKILLKRLYVLFYWGFCWIIDIWLRYQINSKPCSLLKCAILFSFICVLNVLICLLSIVWLNFKWIKSNICVTDLSREVNNEFSLSHEINKVPIKQQIKQQNNSGSKSKSLIDRITVESKKSPTQC